LLQSQFIDIATIESTTGRFLGPYHAAVNLVASADGAAMAEAYVVGMVVPQEQPDEDDRASNDIEALFGDSSDGDVVVPAMMDEQVALLASFETAHCEEGTHEFMAAKREALAAMLVVRANAAREAMRLAVQEKAAHVAARMAKAAADATAQEEMARDRRHWEPGTRTWPRQGALARSRSSPASAATARTWHTAVPPAPARPTARARTPSMPAGTTTCCR
jgi:hypothetical protein